MKAILKINDKEIEVEVSEEQIEKLTEKKKNPFERAETDVLFYKIDAYGDATSCVDCGLHCDDILFKNANYCTDKDLLQQQAYRETLNRLLWRWQHENDDPVDWGNLNTKKSSIIFNYCSKAFDTWNVFDMKEQSVVFFSTNEKAEQAIKEVVKPFMQEHPDFVW